MSKTDELWPGGYRLTFDERAYPPGTDAFLLGAFASSGREERICDLGAGCGILGLLLLARAPTCRVEGLEIQAGAAALMQENIERNALGERMRVQCGDLRQIRAYFAPGSFDRVVSNPPYFKTGSGERAAGAVRQAARDESGCTIDEVCAAAADLLRWGGCFDVVFRAERLSELLVTMTKYRLEPKRLRWVQERCEKAPSLILIEGKKGAHPGVVTMPPLLLRGADGRETPALREIYLKDREAE